MGAIHVFTGHDVGVPFAILKIVIFFAHFEHIICGDPRAVCANVLLIPAVIVRYVLVYCCSLMSRLPCLRCCIYI